MKNTLQGLAKVQFLLVCLLCATGLWAGVDPYGVDRGVYAHVQEAPRVIASIPANGASGVSLTTSISANELYLPNGENGIFGVDNNTVNSRTVKLFNAATGVEIPSTANGTGGGDAINLTPSIPLEVNTSYRFVIDGVQDLTGAVFEVYTAVFTTAADNGGSASALDNVSFRQAGNVATGEYYTSVTIGPDRKLYGLRISGTIDRWNIELDGTLTGKQTMPVIEAKYGARTAIGLVFAPDATSGNLIAYVSHSTGVLTNGPAWDGKISQLSGPDLEVEKLLVTNLPRSRRDHLVNGLTFRPGESNVLYFNVGSNTAGGAPDKSWGFRQERLLSGATLRLDLDKLPPSKWPLNAKTTMDQTAINAANVNSPTLGSGTGTYEENGEQFPDDGTYNPYYSEAPLTLYATGIRNAYDLIWHSNGQLYIPSNGTAGGSNTPASVSGTRRPNGEFYNHSDPSGKYPVIPATFNNNTQRDFLFRVDPTKSLGFYGHANPLRGEFVLNRGPVDVSGYPNSVSPDPNYRGIAFNFEYNKSPNGVIEYRSAAEGGNLQGAMLVCRYSGGSDIIALIPNGPNGDILTSKIGIPGLTGFQDPLDLTEDQVTGNLYVSDFGRQSIVLVKPSENSSPEPAIQLNPISVITDDVADGVPGEDITVFITNTGNAALLRPTVTITGENADQFEANLSTLPTSLDPNRSASFLINFNPTTTGSKIATLKVSGENTTVSAEIDLRGLGKKGKGGNNEPSLQQIFDTYGFAINVGDRDPQTNVIDLQSGMTYNDNLGDELRIQYFKRAVDAPVTLEVLSVYGPEANNPILGFGWYESGISTSAAELFTVENKITSNGQTLAPEINGVSTFNPGSKVFGFYSRWPFFNNRYIYSEDAQNSFDQAIPHHVRVYEVPNVDNTYIVAFEEHTSGFDYQDVVVLVRNVEPAQLVLAPVITANPGELLFEASERTPAPQEDTKTVTITNTGNAPLEITDVRIGSGTYAGNFSFTGPTTKVIAPASSQNYVVTYKPQRNSENLGYQEGSLVFATNAGNGTFTLGLHGLKTIGYEGTLEPPLQDVVNTLGVKVNVGWTTLKGSTDPALQGQEINEPLFEAAGPGPVGIVAVARYSPAETLPYGWYTRIEDNITRNQVGILADGLSEAQTLYPAQESGTSSFNPGRGAFGIYVYSNSFSRYSYTQDDINTGTVTHRTRIYPVRDRQGALVPNSYLVGFEDAENGDYQDYVFVLTNAKPYVAPDPALSFEPEVLNIGAIEGRMSGQYTTELIANTNIADDAVTLTASQPWIVLPGSFTYGEQIDIAVDASKLTVGVYTGTVTATAAGFENGTLTVTATVNERVKDGTIQINFQDNSFNPPAGYLADVGAAYGARGNGMIYGWVNPETKKPLDNTAAARGDERGITNSSSDEDKLLRSFNHLDMFGQNNPHDWEIAVPNGLYKIELAAGDMVNSNSRHTIRAEGETVIDDFVPSSESKFQVGIDTIRVSDGKLTIDDVGAPANGNSKIIYLDIIPVDSSAFAPDISVSIHGNKNQAGEYYGQVKVTLSATDKSGSGGLEEIYYTLNGEGPTLYEGPFDVTIANGVPAQSNTLTVTVKDNFGNQGKTTRSFTLIPKSGAILRLQNMEVLLNTKRGLPADDFYTFNKIERPINFQGDTTITRLENTMRIHNDGSSPLVITRLTTSNEKNFVILGDLVPKNGLTIQPGEFVDAEIRFVHEGAPYRQLITEQLVIASNADNGAEVSATLRGAWMQTPEGSNEISTQQLFEVFGFGTQMGKDANGEYIIRPSSDIPTAAQVDSGAEGDLILTEFFVQADPNQEVRVVQLAALHSRGANTTTFRDANNNIPSTMQFDHGTSWFQALLPWLTNTRPTIAGDRTERVDVPFSLTINGYSSRGGNLKGELADQIVGVKFYKAVDGNGRVIPNEYIVLQDNIGNGCGVGQGNCDWQDNVLYMMNVRPQQLPTASTIANVTVDVLEKRTYDVAPSFNKGYAGNRLAYAATLAGGQPLPTWITFNTTTGVFLIEAGVAQAKQSVQVSVTATDYNNIKVSSSFTINVRDTDITCTVNANTDGQQKVLDCTTGSVRLSGSVTEGEYRWTGPNGFTSSVQNPVVTIAGTYTLKSSGSNCPLSSTVEVIKGATPSNLRIDAPYTTFSCSVSSIELTAVSDDESAAIKWFNGSNQQVSTSTSLVVTSPGTYRAVATSSGGCQASVSVTLDENYDAASAGIDGAISVCRNDDPLSLYSRLAALGGNPQAGGTWTYGGSIVPDSYNPASAPSGTYTYTVGGANGCAVDEAILTISLKNPVTYYADIDRDGFGDPNQAIQTCVAPPGYVTNGSDNCPTVNSTTLSDADGDGIGDGCDPDDDNDGVKDVDDCEPFNSRVGVATFYYADFDGDGFGDPNNGFATCALPPANYVANNTDNCPDNANPNQIDTDGDGIGDICDGSASGSSIFWLEAECGDVGSNWTKMRSDSASNGSYVVFQNGTSTSVPPADLTENQVRFTIKNVQAGTYRLFGRAFAPSPADDSFWVRINGGEWFRWWEGFTHGVWAWNEVGRVPFTLPDGTVTIDIAFREDGARLDKLYLSLDGKIPTGFGEEAINCASINEAPIAIINLQPPYGSAPLAVTLDASESRDTEGAIVSYAWDWGTGTASGVKPRVTFQEGTYNITLTVTDEERTEGTAIAELRVLNGSADTDGDGIINDEDICPLFANPNQVLPTFYADFDNDGLGNPAVFVENCEAPIGYVSNAGDNCPDFASSDVTDTDGDGIGDQCDDDDDGDGVPDAQDCNPLNERVGRFNTYYADTDGDGFGDPAVSITDCEAPADYVLNNTDNCPSVANVDQMDSDNDGIGNACDPSVVGQRIFWLEAECATVGSSWVAGNNTDASNGKYVMFPSGNSFNEPPADVPANRIRFTLNSVQPGNYYVFARLLAKDGGDDSVWFRVNDGTWVRWASGIRQGSNFEWNELLGSPLELPDGTSTIDFAYREDGLQLDKLHVNVDGIMPSGIGEQASNCGFNPNQSPVAVASATPTSGFGPLTVELNGGESSDADGVIVSYDWAWNGGSAVGVRPTATFPDGNYAVTLTVTDEDGATGTDIVNISVQVNQADTDGDGIRDVEDNCPTVANPNQSQEMYYADLDGDGFGDPNNTVMGCVVPENYVTNALDNCPDRTSTNLTDTDGDGMGDVCDPDDDNDGVLDGQDCFPLDPTRSIGTTYYADLDRDGFGDPNNSITACNQPAGYVLNKVDNCPSVPNPTQADADNDGIGDACDSSIAGVNVFWLEAECAQVGGAWSIETDTTASGGSYAVSRTAESKNAAPEDVPANRVRFALEKVRAGRYHIFGRVLAATTGDDSYWIRINTGNWIQWTNGIVANGKFNWSELVNSPFSLQEGYNTIDIAFRENGGQLDKIHIDYDSAMPTEKGEAAINCGTTSDNRRPVAAAMASPLSGPAPLNVQLDGSGSTDSDGSIVSYAWAWEGGSATGVKPSITLDKQGTYDIILTVKDNQGASATDRVTVTVQKAANVPPVAVASARPSSGIAPLQVDLIASASSDQDGTITSYAWNWGSGSATGVVVSQSFPTGVYTVTLTVTDNEGATDTDVITVQAYKQGADTDGDGVADGSDNCPTVPNPDQSLSIFYADEDGDGFGDPNRPLEACTAPNGYVDNADDNCPAFNSSDLTDTDGDGLGDVCDDDDDNDGITDSEDCNPLDSTVGSFQTYFADADQDGYGDPSDSLVVCEQPVNYVLNNTDNCPAIANPDQADSDGDGLGDSCDDNILGFTKFTMEAECAVVGSDWVTRSNTNASGGKYVVYLGTDAKSAPPADVAATRVRFLIESAEAGQYFMYARAFAVNGGDDSFWVRVNEGAWKEWNSFAQYNAYGWNRVTATTFTLSAGTNTVDFAFRENGAYLDKLHLNVENVKPTGFGDLATNCGGDSPNQPPVAQGKPSVTSGYAPLSVTLDGSASIDNDGTITSYAWTWNGGSAQGVKPTVLFETPDIYDITLTVTDNGGATDTDEFSVTVLESVNELPIAVAEATPANGSAPLTVQLDGSKSSDSDGSIVSYDWTWTGGNVAGVSPQITLSTPGVYDIILTVTDNREATAKDTVQVTVTEAGSELPVAVAKATPSSGIAPLSVQLDGGTSSDPDGEIISYEWSWTGGTASGIAPQQVFAAGTYSVVLTVTDNNGNVARDSVTVTAFQDETDTDGDGVYDADDNCPTVANPDQRLPVFYSDADGDGFGDPNVSVRSCEAPDGYVLNALDNCPDFNSPDVTDTDGDGMGDVCDNDDDNDGAEDEFDCDPLDNSVSFKRVFFADVDADGFGDPDTYVFECEQPAGYVEDYTDNCPAVANPEQIDSDGDGIGDACEEAPANDGNYWLEAECMTLNTGWETDSHPAVSNGAYIGSRSQSRFTAPTATSPGSQISTTVDLETEGRYHLFFRMNGWRSESNSFWVKIDDSPWVNFSKFIGGTDLLTEDFKWVKVNDNGTDISFDLAAGQHTLTIANREEYSLLDKMLISQFKSLPADMGGAGVNCESNFSGTPPESGKQADAQPYTLGGEQLPTTEPGMEIFPNPTSDNLNFQLESDHIGRVAVMIMDINGRVIRDFQYEKADILLQDRLNVSELPMGTYTLRVIEGDRQLVRKFVKLR